MTHSPTSPGVVAGRLSGAALAENFSDLHPALSAHEARNAAQMCYFCYDAPCTTACPTDIDIPLFIRQIATGTPQAAARTILSQNILGGMCARVCPTETLCEEACVRMSAEHEPVEIGRLQRYATDRLMQEGPQPFARARATGKRVAVVGAGPAGLACAHRLAMKGHDVVIFEARPKAGGLDEYGIAAYKSTQDFAAREVDWLMGIGGIELRTGQALGRDVELDALAGEYDAVFLGTGLGGVNRLEIPGEDLEGVRDALGWIGDLRQAGSPGEMPVGRRVVVIGGGMTAVDAAVQASLLGAEAVTLAYRRGRDAMKASGFEQELAAVKGVRIVTDATPIAFHGGHGLEAVEFAYTSGAGENFRVPADQALVAIGQKLSQIGGLETENGKIRVTGAGRTSRAGIWAGGDCTPGEDLTVVAVAEGRDAAEDIHTTLMEG